MKRNFMLVAVLGAVLGLGAMTGRGAVTVFTGVFTYSGSCATNVTFGYPFGFTMAMTPGQTWDFATGYRNQNGQDCCGQQMTVSVNGEQIYSATLGAFSQPCNQTLDVSFSAGPAACVAPVNVYVTFCGHNDYGVFKSSYVMYWDGELHDETFFQVIGENETACKTVNLGPGGCCGNTNLVVWKKLLEPSSEVTVFDENGSTFGYDDWTPTGPALPFTASQSPNGSASSGNTTTAPGHVTPTATAVSTNSPIAFSGTDVAATLKEGFNKVYTAIDKESALLGDPLRELVGQGKVAWTLQQAANAKLVSSDNKLGSIDGKLSGLSGMDGKLASIDTKLSGVATANASLATVATGVSALSARAAGDLSSLLSAFGTNNGKLQGIGDKLSGMGTNETGVGDAVRSFHTDNTNLLGAIYGLFSGTNNSDGSWREMSPENKSATAAMAAGTAAVAGGVGGINGMLGDGQGAASGIGGGVAPVWIIPMGQTAGGVPLQMRIAPLEGVWTDMWTTLWKLWNYLLSLGYAAKIAHDLLQIIMWYAGVKGAQIPNMNFTILGNGGNVAGALLYPIVVSVGLAVYATFLAVVFSGLFGALDWHSLFTGGAGGAGGGVLSLMPGEAKAMLMATFPIELAFALVSAYLVFRLTMCKAIMVLQSAARFLPGF